MDSKPNDTPGTDSQTRHSLDTDANSPDMDGNPRQPPGTPDMDGNPRQPPGTPSDLDNTPRHLLDTDAKPPDTPDLPDLDTPAPDLRGAIVQSLTLSNFRNYAAVRVDFSPGSNILVGPNAQGKTNLLDAILCLSGLRPPRARSDRDLIRFDTENALISAQIQARQRLFNVEIQLSRNGRRKMSVNGVGVKTSAALRDLFHTVLFRPEDLLLIRDGPAARRRFLDAALSQIRPRYAAALAAYHDAWTQKTRILRDSDAYPSLLRALPDFSEQMILHGVTLIRYRARYVQRLAQYAAFHHAQCSGGNESLSVRYQTVSAVPDPAAPPAIVETQLRQHMEAHQRAELAAKQCLSGPHKDDFTVSVNGYDARQWSSQGQTRTAALALKLAEREILRNAADEYPVLLLDDVLSELDPVRQTYVLRQISGGQRFLTCCEDNRVPSGAVFRVRAGNVSRTPPLSPSPL